MKKQHLVLATVILILTVLKVNAQESLFSPNPVQNTPYGKKLPPPDLPNFPDAFFPRTVSPPIAAFTPFVGMQKTSPIKKNTEYFRQLLRNRRKSPTYQYQNESVDAKGKSNDEATSKFHLLKDINPFSDGNPRNFTNHTIDIYDYIRNDSAPYAVLNDVAYFVADDGIHGSEFWRSDGTKDGTYMVKDLEPGAASSLLYNITAANGRIYFTAYSSVYGSGAWVSDGTENGTELLAGASEATKYFAWGNKVYFIADGVDFWSTIWETDGTASGTKQIIELGDKGFGGQQITQPTIVNGVLFFIFVDYETLNWRVWRSDLTDTGTYHIGPGYFALDSTGNLSNTIPAQLTGYHDKLYFSADDGTGRKLWVSDGTDAGTTLVPGHHNVIISVDYLEPGFPIVNNTLCVPGKKAPKGNGLYKYNASDTAGLVLIKYFAPVGDTAFIVPAEMHVVRNTVYFKVINYKGGIHDELWSSKGTQTSTRLVQKFLPGERINRIYNGSGICYFVKHDNFFGTELWRTVETSSGTFSIPVSDIFKGPTSSSPAYLTAFKGKLIFGASDTEKGFEIFTTDGSPFSTNLVKDINTVTNLGSNAGFNFYNFYGYKGMVALGNNLLFVANDRVHGYALFKSDGTAAGTELLNDIIPGEAGFEITQFESKNNTAYFIAQTDGASSVYSTTGTKNSLRKITGDYSSIRNFAVTDNGIVFYVSFENGAYKLRRTDGTVPGTVLLSWTLPNLNYLTAIGNTAFFVAKDSLHGNELWKSDGSVAGTKLIKDINPGTSNADPAGMFTYKNAVYFVAYDSTGSDPSFWKSNGTETGTIKLKDIDPYWGNTVASTGRYFCISNNILYFSAINHSNKEGTKLWRTDGTIAGTRPVKDINPFNGNAVLGPYLLTDVNGTLFFTADDGVHGRELWKSNGHYNGTHMVKDITPGTHGSSMNGLTSFGGKLYFQNAPNNRYYLWTSDGTEEGTHAVEDPGIVNVGIAAIFGGANKLFLSGNTSTYGTELYAGTEVDQPAKLIMSRAVNNKIALPLNAVLYPNPVLSNATLQLDGQIKNAQVSITDINGRKLWQSQNTHSMYVKLPTEKYAAGTYYVTVTSEAGSKTIKLVKQ